MWWGRQRGELTGPLEQAGCSQLWCQVGSMARVVTSPYLGEARIWAFV